ncbi:Leucine Rich repeat family protein [Leishmania donovani]|uniref:Leucine Rich repeat family protein n=1 Tax=Leishmania donovani TaxID=5661 RepID=A0A504Y4Q3_LEIDO|nr:Leucine Rich repeat family protein [Leishmania donovani]
MLSTSAVPSVSAGTSSASLTTNWLAQLSASQSANTVAASEHSKVSVPALVGLQRLAGNAFSLHQVSVPWPSVAASSTTGSAGSTASLKHATSLPEAEVAATSTATSISWTAPDKSLRAGWASRTPLPVTAMTVPHPATACAPCSWRGTAGGWRQDKQAAPSEAEQVVGDSGVLMTRPPASLQLNGPSGSLPQSVHPSRLPAYEGHPSDAQIGFATTYTVPLGAPIDMAAPLSPLMQPAPHSLHGSNLNHSGRAHRITLQLHSSEIGSVLSQTAPQRNSGGNDARDSASQQSLLTFTPRDEATFPAAVRSGLSSLPPPLKAPMPLPHRAIAASEMHTPAHVTVDGALMNGQRSLPRPADALCNLLQQYIDARRALQPDARQQLGGVPGKLTVPLDIQELVLRQVQDFALQLDAAAHPHAPPHEREAVGSSDQDHGVESGTGGPLGDAVPPPLLSAAAAHKGDEVPWDIIFGYLAHRPTAAHATLRAVAPASRRRLEQLGWRWMIAKVAMSVCPFIQESDAEGFVRDAYARLDGQERQYVGSVPVARRTPLLPLYRPTLAKSERLLDGSALLHCERQSLLLDWAWREGWLHRLTCTHHAFVLPRLSGGRTVLSRICVDGVFCDVLRPKQNRLDGGAVEGKGGSGGAFTTSGGAGDMRAKAASGAQLTPPPLPILEKRPTEAFSATRKLLDDAVSAISREWARSAGAPRSKQLQATLAPFSQPSRANTPSSTVTAAMASSLASPPQEVERTYRWDTVTDLQHHPHYGHASLPVLVEDVSGTAHLLCTNKTRLDTAEVRGWVSAWLQHRHRLPRQPICTSAAEFLLVRSPSAPLRAIDDEGSEGDRVVCTNAAAAAPSLQADAGRTRRTDGTPPRAEGGAAPDPPLLTDSLVFNLDGSRDHAHILNAEGLAGVVAVGEVGHAGRDPAAEYHFRVHLQDWRNKGYGVVRRMNEVDPPWLMLGNASGPQPRPLALHLTEQHIPWLAHQLCPDSEGGGLLDLQELHLFVTESLLPPGWAAAWRWCIDVLRDRKNLLVLSVAARPWAPVMTEGAASDVHSECKPHDASEVIGVLDAFTAHAAMFTAPLQVLSLQGAVADAAAPLFCVVNRGAHPEIDGEGGSPALERLRELYVSVRSGQGSGGSPCSVGLDDVHVTATVYPVLQVLWLDAPRLRHIHLDDLLVLRELHLISEAPLACSALRGVERLPHLEVVHLERAVIDDCSFFGDCPALRELLLHACRLSLFPPSFAIVPDCGGGRLEELRGVERAPRLETLSLCYTEEVRNLQNFARCRSLRRILLTRCNGISSSSIAGLEHLPRLELLAMEYTRVSGLSHFASTPALRILRVDGCKRVLHSSVMGLENAAVLTELSLKNTNVSTVANFGGGCRSLRSLDLSGCRHLDVDGLQGIQALPQLEVLCLSHMPITDVNFLADCVRLTALYLEGCTELLPTSLEGLQHAPRLRKIVANGCPTLTRVGRLGKCAALEVFAVTGATALTVEGLQGIEQGGHIEYLDLSSTAVHTLHFLVGGCRALRYLSVKGCRRITSMRALHGVEKLPRLQALNMESLDVHGPLDFLATSTSLRYVSYAGCARLSSDDVQALRRSGVQAAIP